MRVRRPLIRRRGVGRPRADRFDRMRPTTGRDGRVLDRRWAGLPVRDRVGDRELSGAVALVVDRPPCARLVCDTRGADAANRLGPTRRSRGVVREPEHETQVLDVADDVDRARDGAGIGDVLVVETKADRAAVVRVLRGLACEAARGGGGRPRHVGQGRPGTNYFLGGHAGRQAGEGDRRRGVACGRRRCSVADHARGARAGSRKTRVDSAVDEDFCDSGGSGRDAYVRAGVSGQTLAVKGRVAELRAGSGDGAAGVRDQRPAGRRRGRGVDGLCHQQHE